jgi:hypothetical protein
MPAKTIWKFPLKLQPTGPNLVDIPLPRGSRPLSIQYQDNIPVVWVLLDPITAGEIVDYRFRMVGTGWEMIGAGWDAMTYLATVQHGPFVWHWFYQEGV